MKMKMLYAVISCSMMTLIGSCQKEEEQKVPQSVLATFQAKYPNEEDAEWEIDDHGYWEAHFKVNDEKYRADFETNGLWVETENSIKKSELPEAVLEAIERDYGEEKITEVERVTHHSKGLFFDVEFNKKGKNKDVEYLPDGTIIE